MLGLLGLLREQSAKSMSKNRIQPVRMIIVTNRNMNALCVLGNAKKLG